MQRNRGAYGKDSNVMLNMYMCIFATSIFNQKTITRRRVLCYNVCKCYAKFCSGIVIDDERIFCNEVSNDIRIFNFNKRLFYIVMENNKAFDYQ